MERSELFRLVLAKRFLQEARANVRRDDAESLAVAVVNMHDGFDNLLGALASHLAVHIPDDTTMLRTYDRIGSAGHAIGSRAQVAQMNAIRNEVKHHGLHPNGVVVRQLVPELLDIADDLSLRFFGTALSDVHLVDAIEDEGVRRDMALVRDVMAAGDYRNALEQLAFIMFNVYERQAFGLARTIRRFMTLRDGTPPDVEFPDIDRTQQRLDFVELGLDQQEYEAFHWVVPRIGLRAGSDTAYISRKSRHTWHAANWTRSNCERAFDFLLRLILAKQDRPSRPALVRISPVDKITFVVDSVVGGDKELKEVVARVKAGDALLALTLPYVDGAWQNHGEELVFSNLLIENEWQPAYFRKRDVTVTPDVEIPEP